jgi:hypothetical protein
MGTGRWRKESGKFRNEKKMLPKGKKAKESERSGRETDKGERVRHTCIIVFASVGAMLKARDRHSKTTWLG